MASFDPHLAAEADERGTLLAWVAGAIILALIFGAGVWFALDRAVPVAPIVEMPR